MQGTLYIAGTIQHPVYRGKRAKQYPFVLDNFQEISIACLVRLSSSFST